MTPACGCAALCPSPNMPGDAADPMPRARAPPLPQASPSPLLRLDPSDAWFGGDAPRDGTPFPALADLFKENPPLAGP